MFTDRAGGPEGVARRFMGGLLGWVSGTAADRLGPRLGTICGGTLAGIVVACEWLVAREFVPAGRSPLTVFCVLGFMLYGCTGTITASVFGLLSCSFRADEQRGSIVGLAKAWVGLCGAVTTTVYGGFATSDSNSTQINFMLVMIGVVVLLSWGPAIGLSDTKPPLPARREGPDEGVHVYVAQRRVVCAVIIVMVAATAFTALAPLAYTPRLICSIIILALFLSPLLTLLMPVRGDGDGSRRHLYSAAPIDERDVEPPSKARCCAKNGVVGADGSGESGSDLLSPLQAPSLVDAWDDPPLAKLSAVQSTECGSEVEVASRAASEGTLSLNHQPTTDTPAAALEGLTTAQMLQTPTAWLMLWTVISIFGGGTIVTINGSQMAEAVGLDSERGAEAVVTLFSVAQALGRLGSGMAADVCTTRGQSAAQLLVLAALSMTLGHSIMSIGSPSALYAGVVSAGFGFGMVWPLMVLLTREFFGPAHVGANYMIYDGMGASFGALFFAKLLVHPFYSAHSHAVDDPTDDGASETCTGKWCFPYVVVAALNLLATVAAALVNYLPKPKFARHPDKLPTGAE